MLLLKANKGDPVPKKEPFNGFAKVLHHAYKDYA